MVCSSNFNQKKKFIHVHNNNIIGRRILDQNMVSYSSLWVYIYFDIIMTFLGVTPSDDLE